MQVIPTVIVYHGTTTPVETLRTVGIQIKGMETIRSYVDMKIRSLPSNLKRRKLLKLLPSLPPPIFIETEWSNILVTGVYKYALEYTVGPPEVISHWLWGALPRPLALEAIKTLMEISDGKVYGKVVTLEIPTSWLTGGSLEYPIEEIEEIELVRSIPPSCIRKIEYTKPISVNKVLREVVEDFDELEWDAEA